MILFHFFGDSVLLFLYFLLLCSVQGANFHSLAGRSLIVQVCTSGFEPTLITGAN